MAVTQVALLVLGLMLAGVGPHPDSIWVVGSLALAIALASASQDIAIDAYAVEVLRKDEQGAAAGARTALYRGAYTIAGGVAISLAGRFGWPAVNVMLALVFVPMLIVTWKSPEPDVQAAPPPTLREAVWQPFLSFLTRPRAIEILAFVVLYKLSDQLTQALTRPFLIDMGYNADQRGVAVGLVTLTTTIIGAIFGGWLTTLVGLGHSLWIFGFLQLFSNVGYYIISILESPVAPVLYAAAGFEFLTSGMGTGAFSVLLLRLTEKRFSATQYALFSSLFALPRVAAGPITGFAVSAMGWPSFYLATLAVGIPGLVMLHRFVPIGVREPNFEIETRRAAAPAAGMLGPGVVAAAGLTIAAAVVVALLDAMQAMRGTPPVAFDIGAAFWRLAHPADVNGWLQIVGILAFAAVGGLFIAATRARQPGTARP
jgi:PAT family beta-lactamase induction signal transducer AmpG